ncbi:MAG: hypothetical protein HDS35_07565 [Bacteroides sp.]|nr:hypothetical protein [Bacteroides sp.]
MAANPIPIPRGFRFTRQHAKMIAEEMIKLLRKDVVGVMGQVVKEETTEFICTKEAALLLGVSVGRLYQTKDSYGCYTKVNGRIKFDKHLLIRRISEGSVNLN